MNNVYEVTAPGRSIFFPHIYQPSTGFAERYRPRFSIHFEPGADTPEPIKEQARLRRWASGPTFAACASSVVRPPVSHSEGTGYLIQRLAELDASNFERDEIFRQATRVTLWLEPQVFEVRFGPRAPESYPYLKLHKLFIEATP